MEDLGIAWEPMLIAVIMMTLDIIFGFAEAWKNNDIRSDKMREGLWHKAGFCGLIILAFAYEVGASWVNFEAHIADLGILMPELPAVTSICVFIFATEVISIIENLCGLNPRIAELPVFSMFKPHDPDAADISVSIQEFDKKEGTD